MLHLNKSLDLGGLSFQENKEMHLKPIKIETSALQSFTRSSEWGTQIAFQLVISELY